MIKPEPPDLTVFHLHGELRAVSKEASDHAAARIEQAQRIAVLEQQLAALQQLPADSLYEDLRFIDKRVPLEPGVVPAMQRLYAVIEELKTIQGAK